MLKKENFFRLGVAVFCGMVISGCVGYDFPPKAENVAVLTGDEDPFLPDQPGGPTHQEWLSDMMLQLALERIEGDPEPDRILTYGYDLAFPTPDSMYDFEPIIGALLENRRRYIFMIGSDDVFSDTHSAVSLARRRVHNLITELLVRGVYLSQMYHRLELPRAALSNPMRLDPYARVIRVYLLDMPEEEIAVSILDNDTE